MIVSMSGLTLLWVLLDAAMIGYGLGARDRRWVILGALLLVMQLACMVFRA